MYLPRSDSFRPDRAVLIVMCLADRCCQTADTDTVASHDRGLALAVCIDIGHIHGFCIFGSKLEDISDLDTSGDLHGLFAAFRADAALLDFCKIVILGIRNVALHVESFVMMLCLVGSAGKVVSSLEGFIIENNGISVHLQVHRSDIACVQSAFFGDHGCVNLLAEEVDQLRLVDFKITADEKDNVFIINILLINNGFAGVLCLVSEEIADVFNGVDVRCINLFECSGFCVSCDIGNVLSCLHVGSVIAGITQNDGILSDRSQKHELMGDVSAHHTGIGFDRYHLRHADTLEDALVCCVAFLVILLQIFLAGMEGVSILHRKLTHTDQSGSRTGLITEFCLDLIDHKRIFGVALCILANEMYGCLLVGHAEYHFGIVAVGETQQLIADAIVTAGLIPQRSRHDNRELHFLAVDFVHLLAQDLLDFAHNAAQRQIGRIDSVCHIFDVSAFYHNSMAVDDTVSRSFFEALSY